MKLIFLKYTLSSHHVIQVNEGVIDGHHLDLAPCGSSTSHQTTDTPKSETQDGTVSKKKSQRDQYVNSSISQTVQHSAGVVTAAAEGLQTEPRVTSGGFSDFRFSLKT